MRVLFLKSIDRDPLNIVVLAGLLSTFIFINNYTHIKNIFKGFNTNEHAVPRTMTDVNYLSWLV